MGHSPGQADAPLVAAMRHARRILVFSGAGLSTRSGIPDFRGPNGVWKRRQPVMFDEFLASEERRVEYWETRLEGWPAMRDARPNDAHRAIAALERLGKVHAVVTQNIDGLHQAAGSSPERVVEVHGTARRIACLSCETDVDPDEAMREFERTRRAPRCACGGLLKSATISFGQPLRPETMAAAERAARTADLVMALGSTLSVYPAAAIPLIAHGRGIPYVVINQGPTEHDDVATLRLEGDVVDLLPPAVAALE